MINSRLLESIFKRFGNTESEVVFSADEVCEWSPKLLEVFIKHGLLRSINPATVIECMGCEENCISPVHIFPAQLNRPSRAFIACDKRDDVGRVPIEFHRLQQWHSTRELIANLLAQLLGFDPPQCEGHLWSIGVLKGKKRKGLITLANTGELLLQVAGHEVLLWEIVELQDNEIIINKSSLMKLVDKPAPDLHSTAAAVSSDKPVNFTNFIEIDPALFQPEVGSPEWRKQNAKAAANAKHNQPGGARDKQRQIQAIWATGKYSSRDVCAEQESAALDMSFSTARKALINTPEPQKNT